MFTTYLLNRLSHLGHFYKSEQEFIEHLLSGEVKIPIPDILDYIKDYENYTQQPLGEKLIIGEELVKGPAIEIPEELSTNPKAQAHVKTLRMVECIFHTYIKMNKLDDLQMVTDGASVYFHYFPTNTNNTKGNMHKLNNPAFSSKLDRDLLVQLESHELTKIIIDNIREAYWPTKLPSTHQPNDIVELDLLDAGKILNCEIVKVHFSESKVLYDLSVEMSHPTSKTKMYTRLHNIDSIFVK